jgi:hypothetical protein
MPSPPAVPSNSPCSIPSPASLSGAFSTWLPTLAPWSLYVTLTYDPKRPAVHHVPPSVWASTRHLRRWHAEAGTLLGRPVNLVAGFESTRAGWPHWHGLLEAGRVSRSGFTALSQTWFAAHGYARFERVRPGTQGVVAGYVSKYLTKGGSEMVFLGPFGAPPGEAPPARQLRLRPS